MTDAGNDVQTNTNKQTNKQILYLSRVKYKMALNKNKTQKKKNHTDPTNYYTSYYNKN